MKRWSAKKVNYGGHPRSAESYWLRLSLTTSWWNEGVERLTRVWEGESPPNNVRKKVLSVVSLTYCMVFVRPQSASDCKIPITTNRLDSPLPPPVAGFSLATNTRAINSLQWHSRLSTRFPLTLADERWKTIFSKFSLIHLRRRFQIHRSAHPSCFSVPKKEKGSASVYKFSFCIASRNNQVCCREKSHKWRKEGRRKSSQAQAEGKSISLRVFVKFYRAKSD